MFLTPTEKRKTSGPIMKGMQAEIKYLVLENDFIADALGCIDGACAKK